MTVERPSIWWLYVVPLGGVVVFVLGLLALGLFGDEVVMWVGLSVLFAGLLWAAVATHRHTRAWSEQQARRKGRRLPPWWAVPVAVLVPGLVDDVVKAAGASRAGGGAAFLAALVAVVVALRIWSRRPGTR